MESPGRLQVDLWGRQARTPGEGESHVGVLRAGLQGARGGQKTRAGETRVLWRALGGGSQEATALSSVGAPEASRLGELERAEGSVFKSSELSQGSG